MKRIITLRLDEQEFTVTAYRKEDAIIVERDGVAHTVQVLAERADAESVAAARGEKGAAPKKVTPPPARPGPARRVPPQPAQTTTTSQAESVGEGVAAALAPMAGVIKEVLVAAGDEVTEGQRVVVMEAMKMDVYANAPTAGTVRTVSVSVSDVVEGGNVLLTIQGEGA